MANMRAPSSPKAILITGASSGIGLCAARELRVRGYQVITTARKQEDLERLQSEGFLSVLLDLNSSTSIRNAVDTTLEYTGGQLFALFNNAAYGQPGAVEDLSREALREQFETNLFGPHELTRLLIPIMRQQGYGRIIQNSSLLGLVAMKYRGAYNASKFALEGLSDTLRLELRGTGIYVILIEPGPILSRFRTNSQAQFLHHIDMQASQHARHYQVVQDRLTKEGAAVPFTLPPEAVVRKLLHALESPHPKIRYYVTFPTYLFAALKRLLPYSILDNVLAKI